MDVVEAGRDIARRCYWDFGRWSDTWRAWRAPSDDRGDAFGVDLEVRHCAGWDGKTLPEVLMCHQPCCGAHAGADAALRGRTRRGALGAMPGRGAQAGHAALPRRCAGRLCQHHQPHPGAPLRCISIATVSCSPALSWDGSTARRRRRGTCWAGRCWRRCRATRGGWTWFAPTARPPAPAHPPPAAWPAACRCASCFASSSAPFGVWAPACDASESGPCYARCVKGNGVSS